mmetsp:Transcript_17364/g.60204  ORF Transcript_17364/g.60204 Transcript_17364/m.60204 type:complete len:222 (-) Transcript_17364:1243-1908(-)
MERRSAAWCGASTSSRRAFAKDQASRARCSDVHRAMTRASAEGAATPLAPTPPGVSASTVPCATLSAMASKSTGTSTRAVANAQMSKARSAALKPASLSGLKTSFSAAANNAGETRPAVAYAAKMREIIWVWKVGILDGASKAIALKRSRCDSAGPAVENVHAMEARFWALNSFTRSSATAATASKSRGEATPAFENAQTVLVRFWALNVVIFRTASCATA